MQPTYLFYDIESTGIDKCFDQVLQFAAIRTDLDLNEIERVDFMVQLSADTIPSAMATMTHHISLNACKKGLNELEAIEKIHHIMNKPGTISLGYNTLTFDDEFLRFSFYRHLLPPYTHQFKHQCARMDLYPMTVMYYLYKPEVLTWPTRDNKPTMKLEEISRTNQLATGRAHDAMVDVEATLALAKRFKKEEAMWHYVLGYFDKTVEKRRLNQLPITLTSQYGTHREGLMILGRFGSRNNYCSAVLDLGEHRHYKNQHIWLRLDLPELNTVKSEMDSIKKNTWVMHKKLAEPGFILPNINRFNQHLSEEKKQIINTNITFLNENPSVFHALIDYHLDDKYSVFPETDPQAGLYQSQFWTPKETQLCEQFHQGDPNTKRDIIARFDNPDLIEMATRLMGRHFPELLKGDAHNRYQDHLAKTQSRQKETLAIDFRGNARYGITNLIDDITTLRQNPSLSNEQLALLDELEVYVAV